MIFKSFTLLVAVPVHEESVRSMNHGYGHNHVHRYAERGHPAEKARDQTDRPGKFRRNGKKGKYRRNMHLPGKKAHGAVETVASEPSQYFLRPVRKHRDTQSKPDEE